MMSRPSQSLMRLDRLRRGVAIFLLAFAFIDVVIVDVFLPQLCRDGQASTSSPAKSTNKATDKATTDKSIGKIAAELAPIRDHGSLPGQNSHESSADEDCFCCCSHIVPSPHVNVATLNCPPQLDDPAIFSLPLAHPYDAFHPPRLS